MSVGECNTSASTLAAAGKSYFYLLELSKIRTFTAALIVNLIRVSDADMNLLGTESKQDLA